MRNGNILTLAAVTLLPLCTQCVAPAPRPIHREARTDQVAAVIRDCERRTEEFKVALRHALEHSRAAGTIREEDLDQDAMILQRTMAELRESWNREHDYERSRHHLRAALGAGRDLNRHLAHHRLHNQVNGQWDAVRGELNRLADVFSEPRIRWE